MDWGKINDSHPLPELLETPMPYLERAMPLYNALRIILEPLGSLGIILYGLLTWIIIPGLIIYFTLFFLKKSGKLFIELLESIDKKKPVKYRNLYYILIYLLTGCIIGFLGGAFTIIPLVEIVFVQVGR